VSVQVPDLTILVVGSDRAAVSATLESVMWQTEAVASVAQCSPSGLKDALADVQTEWLCILPQGSQVDPLWVSRAKELLLREGIGAVGGHTLEMRGARTLGGWFDSPSAVTFVDWLGRCHSRLEDVPSKPMSGSALFLRWDNMACRTEIVREALSRSDDVIVARHATAPCAIAIRQGLQVQYNSELRCARQVQDGADSMLAEPAAEVWYRIAAEEAFELANLPRRSLAARAVISSVLLGTRQSPGLFLGFAYAWWPLRRQRWWAFFRGKCAGILRAYGLGAVQS